MKMIKTDKLVFEYAKRDEEGNIIGMSRAVDEVDLDIEPGQFIAILGHNGSGKSTLAKHMNAILVPTEGTMWVDGKDTKEEEYLWDIRQSAGMVFQNPDNQIIGTVVEEDVGFGPENLGVPTEQQYLDMEKAGASFEELEHLTLGGLRRAVVDGDVVNGSVMAGQSAAMVKEILSCEELIQKLVKETDALIGGLNIYG